MSECGKEHIASEDYRKPPKRFSISYRELANDSVLIAFAVCIDKLTSRLNLTEEEVNNSVCVNVLIEERLSAGDILNDCLVSSRIELQATDSGGLQIVSLEEHVVNVLSVKNVACESYRKPPKWLSVTVRQQVRQRG